MTIPWLALGLAAKALLSLISVVSLLVRLSSVAIRPLMNGIGRASGHNPVGWVLMGCSDIFWPSVLEHRGI